MPLSGGIMVDGMTKTGAFTCDSGAVHLRRPEMRAMRATMLSTLMMAFAVTTVCGQELAPMNDKAKQQALGILKDHLGQIKTPQVKIDPDPVHTVGLKIKQDGILLVPQKGLAESAEDEATRTAVRSQTGASLGYLLFTSSFTPVIDGKTVDAKKMRKIEVETPRGEKRAVYCLLLAVRQASEDDWRLFVYGTEKKPLIDIPFDDAAAEQPGPVAIRVEDVSGFRGKLVVNVLKKYEAGFQFEYGG